MSILFLTSEDFQLRTGDRGAMLCLKNSHEYPGLALVLYYSNDCPYCGPVIAKFKELPSRVTGCTFAMCNVSHAMDVVETSKNTISPIRYVPDLVLFVNGAPFMRYDGQQEVAAIQNFLHDVYNKLQHKTAFASSEAPPNATAQQPRAHHFSEPPTG
ncbi:thioredoxin, partial [bacterium]|nr:thioredoxin [bacterium]